MPAGFALQKNRRRGNGRFTWNERTLGGNYSLATFSGAVGEPTAFPKSGARIGLPGPQ